MQNNSDQNSKPVFCIPLSTFSNDQESLNAEKIDSMISPNREHKNGKSLQKTTEVEDRILLTDRSIDNSSRQSFFLSSRQRLNSEFIKKENSISEVEENQLDMNFDRMNQLHLKKKLTKYTRKRKENPHELKKIIKTQKIKLIVRNFIKKLKRNNPFSQPIEFYPFQKETQLGLLDSQGLEINEFISIGIAILSVFQIVTLSIIYTLSIVFEEVNSSPTVQTFQTFSLIFYFFEIGINFITVKLEEGKKLLTLREIWSFYFENNFAIDAISLLILVADISTTDVDLLIYLRLFIIFKLGVGLEKIERLEIFFINNFYNQQYWSLIKVFLFNFSFAHILAIFLVGMASIDEQQNWMLKKGIENAEWIEKYVWSYYWATTMMLTVGFGDLAATTYSEAIILALIQMISCIALAYNINCVGNLINNIRSQDLEKSKNFKIFRKLARKNDVSEDLEWRVNNYIEESSNIKKKFNYEEENFFVEKLPKGLKTEFLKESNKKIFQNLPFFKNLMEKTLFTFAQKIEMHICHPQQIIQHIDEQANLLILKGGEIGYTVKKPGCEFNTKVIDHYKISEIDEPCLISLNFIRQQHRDPYEIKSLEYSILYFLDNETLKSILRGSQMDYELYCLLRDKSPNIPDEFELYSCKLCQEGRHTKFTCPKLHFIPIKQHVVNKYIHHYKNDTEKRNPFYLRKTEEQYRSLKAFKALNSENIRENAQKRLKKGAGGRSRKRIGTNVFMDRKKFEVIQDQSASRKPTVAQQISEMKDFFNKNTAELIKNEMTKVFQNGEGHDEVWLVQADKMKNFKNYFEMDNSCNLSEKFSSHKRLSKAMKSKRLDSSYSEDSVLQDSQTMSEPF